MARFFVLLCCALLCAFYEGATGVQVESIRDQPNVPIQHVVPAGKPNRRPIPRPPRPRPVVIVRPRPPNYRVTIIPVMHPMPIYQIHVNHYNKSVEIPKSSCVNPSGESISSFCQKQAARDFSPQSLNTTFAACCNFWIETDCYRRHAGEFCSEPDKNALIEHSQKVANFFNGTICRGVSYQNFMTSCDKKKHEEEAKQFLKTAQEQQLRPHFIELPKAEGLEQVCFNKLRNHSEGNWKSSCLRASLDQWDQQRRKLMDSYIYESCCATSDAINCLVVQANRFCTAEEAKELAHYQKVSATAFSQGVCRSVPFDRANEICRGKAFGAMPSVAIITLLIALVLTRLCSIGC